MLIFKLVKRRFKQFWEITISLSSEKPTEM